MPSNRDELADSLLTPPEPAALLGDVDDHLLVEEMQKRGWILHLNDPRIERHIKLDAPKRGRVKIGVESDTHLCSKYQQLTHWREFARICGEAKVDYMLHCGDVFDGTHKMHRGMEFEQFLHGASAHVKYAIENFPEVKVGKRSITHKIIGGNHDGSYFKDTGTDVLGMLAVSRDDIEFIGAPSATFHISGLQIYMLHPDGGVPYARSYKPQKAIEQIAPDEKPNIWMAGHWHVPIHVPGYRNVEAFTLPCFQSQTPYLRMKSLAPVIGGLILDIEFSERGLESIQSHWVRFPQTVDKDWP